MELGTAITTARAAFDAGRTSDALMVLKTRLRANPDDLDARRELAETYRKLGHADQAARWGLRLPGWSTKREIAAFGRAFVTPGVSREHIAHLLDLPASAALPNEVERLLAAPPADPNDSSRLISGLESTAGILFGGVIIGALVTVVATTVVAFLGLPDARFVARLSTTVTALAVVFSGGTWFVASVLRHRWASAGVTLVAIVPAALLFYWLAPSPGAYFPWEGAE